MKFLRNDLKSRLPLILLALCLITCAAASMVYAKYAQDQKNGANIDIIAQGELTIPIEGPEKNSAGIYTVQNTNSSNIPAYVRVCVVVNWQDENGNLWASPPKENIDYTISAYNCEKLGDFYYYKGVCNPSDIFSISVTTTDDANAPHGYSLHVVILSEGIQTIPDTAVRTAWGVCFENGNWSPASN